MVDVDGRYNVLVVIKFGTAILDIEESCPARPCTGEL
jgi:hypothetical protein